jgi:T5SS/PEP-CTERM-associated repeat protein
VIVTGSQSIWTCYAFAVIGGLGRDNSLVISNGGRVRSSGVSIGSGDGSNNSALVTGTNSRWTNTGWLNIGGGIGNSLIVSNGGTIINSNGCIGNDSTSVNNYVLVEGSNSLWTNSGDVTIGYAGDGILTVANGGTVAATGGITIASQSGSTGTLNIGAVGGNDNSVVYSYDGLTWTSPSMNNLFYGGYGRGPFPKPNVHG